MGSEGEGQAAWPQGEEDSQEVIARTRKAEAGQKQPLACPRCKLAYVPSSKPPMCPGCGFVIDGDPVRRIRMGAGQLKEVPAYQKAVAEKSEAQRLFSKWQSALYRGLRCHHTYGQCAYLFHKETGKHPQDGWPGVHEQGDLAWKIRVSDQHDFRSLTMETKDALRKIQ